MFSSKEYLDRKTGPDGVDRFNYLQALVTEYQDTQENESKEQILANLANFAYDPVNYSFIRRLNILDLFLDSLEESDEKLVEFGLGGLCNACLDKENKKHILESDGVPLVTRCLSSHSDVKLHEATQVFTMVDYVREMTEEALYGNSSEETVLSAMTTLMYLVTPQSQAEITGLPVVECMLRFAACPNPRLSNLATVFLEDYCSQEQVAEAREVQRQMASQPSSTDQGVAPSGPNAS